MIDMKKKSHKKTTKKQDKRGLSKEPYKGLDKLLYFLSLVIILSGIAMAFTLFDLSFIADFFKKQETTISQSIGTIDNVTTTDEIVEVCEKTLALTGECIEPDELQYAPLVAVMIENHVDARPQSGLVDASIVYEVPVEANYSRFLALYPITTDVSKIGPVRSSRPYFLDWMFEYGKPLYLHVGGSNAALDKIKTNNVVSVNEMTKSWFFWRSKDRYAPHNTYTSSKLWNQAYKKYIEDVEYESYSPWKFSNNVPPCQQDCVSNIDVTFLSPDYTVNWKYNKSIEQYQRYQGRSNTLHVDQDGRLISADTIIVQHVTSQVLDNVGRLSIDTIGSGNAEVYQNGHKISGTWKKETAKGRTRWYDQNGDQIPLNAGKIWIEVVNQRGSVESS